MIASEDVRRVTFDRAMRGYRCEDVDDYLKQVADSMDELAANNDEMQKKLVILAQRIDQYRADEDALSTSMINAQRLGENVIREAKQKAAEIIRAANIRAEDREQRARDEVELAQQELVTVKKEADAFKKKLMELYRQHIEVLSKIPSYPEEPSEADLPEEPAAVPDPEPMPVAEPEPEPVEQPQPEPEEEPAQPEPEYPAYQETPEFYGEESVPQPVPEPEPEAAEEDPEPGPDPEKVDTVEFAFAPKPAAKPGRKDTAAGESRFQPGAGLYDEGEIPEKKSAPRSRGTSGRGAAKGSKKPRSSTAKQPADFDSFNDLDYDV